jgi:mannose-6-phosphate isomerase-like protein (cupin superfamily)
VPIIHGASAPVFTIPNVTFTGLASPSRGAQQTCVWQITLDPESPGAPHMVDAEEIFVVLSGRAGATVGEERHTLGAGDALVVPPHTTFALGNPHGEPVRLVAVQPVGGRAILPGEEPFAPPWTQ